MLESVKEVELHQKSKWKFSIISYLVSLISVLFTQSTLSLLPYLFPVSYYIILLPLSVLLLVIVVGLGGFCKKVAGVRASALAFVFFTIFFIWTIYNFVVRKVISSLLNIVFNIEIIMIILGLCCIMSSDPGFVTRPLVEVDAQEETFMRHGRVRYCKHCKSHVMGFDHHCPAFGNCIGERNHALFLALLIGFVVSEASYVVSAYHFISKFQTSKDAGGKTIACRNLVAGSMLFCLIQVVWQVAFVIWHVYCACFNIKTDEWVINVHIFNYRQNNICFLALLIFMHFMSEINWRKYPEFQIKVSIPHVAGELESSVRFINPYNKGILHNLKEFVSAKA